MATNVYIDGLNLYYGALKGTPYRWLDLEKLCRMLLPRDRVTRIKYFTAIVKPLRHNPGQSARQQTYVRALATLTNVDLHFGQFLSHVVKMPLADGSGMVEVIKAEEKGSDVALAAHLVHDAHRGEYGTAVVISNDSDLVPPIRIVRSELGKQVGLISPHKRPSVALLAEVGFVRHIRAGALKASQFPPLLTDANGTFHKPPSW